MGEGLKGAASRDCTPPALLHGPSLSSPMTRSDIPSSLSFPICKRHQSHQSACGEEAGWRMDSGQPSQCAASTYCVQGPVNPTKSDRKKPNEGGACGRQ